MISAKPYPIVRILRERADFAMEGMAIPYPEFIPRLLCPLSLSYDHRVIDGADGAAFTSYLSKLLSDVRRLLM